MSSRIRLTSPERAFLEPRNATHRQYEALRAYFVEKLPSAEVAARFGYTPGSFRVMCCKFAQNPDRPFFLPPGSRNKAPGDQEKPRDPVREEVVALRKQNLSVYDISRTLAASGKSRSPVGVWKILEEEGFAALPRRRDEERPAYTRPETADVADVRQVDLGPREFRTKFGGLFLFVPMLVQLGFDAVIRGVHLPGTKMIPAPCAMRSLLGLKLYGNARHGHVMSYVLDEGLALFAGLNTIPKRSFLTEYSCRIEPDRYPELMRRWFDAAGRIGLERGVSFDLDFHTIPFHGEDALMERHYVSKRSRRQKGVLAFLAQDAGTRVFCYANGQIRKADQNDEILRFVDFWRERTGRLPEELVFDSKLTTYANLNRLNQMGIAFITLRRRSAKLLQELDQRPASAWRRVELDGVSRAYRTPRVLDDVIQLADYDGPIRQLSIVDLGHEEPTLLLTNQAKRSPKALIERYAQRMLIENGIANGIDFFHMDALSSSVAMKVNCDLQLTLMASSLYRLLAVMIGNGYERAKASHVFRDLVDAPAHVTVGDDSVVVRLGKRAHNPLLLAAGFSELEVAVPWWADKKLRFTIG